jgi:hypothetical protein
VRYRVKKEESASLFFDCLLFFFFRSFLAQAERQQFFPEVVNYTGAALKVILTFSFGTGAFFNIFTRHNYFSF